MGNIKKNWDDHHEGHRHRKNDGGNLLAELKDSSEFREDLQLIASSANESEKLALQVGQIADKWLGDQRYSRVLNPRIFAQLLEELTGLRKTRRMICNYIAAFKEHRFILDSGNQFPHLSPTHLAEISNCRFDSDEEKLGFMRWANDHEVPVLQIRSKAAKFQSDRLKQERGFDLTPRDSVVRQMDAIDLLTEQEDKSISCIIIDWEWHRPAPRSKLADLPKPHLPDDPVAHVTKCLEIAARKLSPEGLICLHFIANQFLDTRIVETIERCGLAHAGEFIWHKKSGGFSNNCSPLMFAHEPIILIRHAEHDPESRIGGVRSVSPQWQVCDEFNENGRHHPHQKPVELYETLIGLCTKAGDRVVDLFAGSGSAGIAAQKLGCLYSASELVPEFVELANKRIACAKDDHGEVLDAVDFFSKTATTQERTVLFGALERAGLSCVREEADHA